MPELTRDKLGDHWQPGFNIGVVQGLSPIVGGPNNQCLVMPLQALDNTPLFFVSVEKQGVEVSGRNRKPRHTIENRWHVDQVEQIVPFGLQADKSTKFLPGDQVLAKSSDGRLYPPDTLNWLDGLAVDA